MTLLPEHKSTCPANAGGECNCGAWNDLKPGPIQYLPVEMPTLRDRFAMAALQGLSANARFATVKVADIAEWSYEQADAMLKARENKA